MSHESDSRSEANFVCCHKSGAWSHFIGSIILDIDRNITDSIIRKVLTVWKEERRIKNEVTSALRKYYCKNLPSRKVVYCWEMTKQSQKMAWNSIKLVFENKTSMPNPAESLGYIKTYYSSSKSRPIKSHMKSYWNSEKRSHFSRWSTSLLFIYLLIYLFICLFVFLLIKTLLTTERVPTGR